MIMMIKYQWNAWRVYWLRFVYLFSLINANEEEKKTKKTVHSMLTVDWTGWFINMIITLSIEESKNKRAHEEKDKLDRLDWELT